jgi:hypothetical protein
MTLSPWAAEAWGLGTGLGWRIPGGLGFLDLALAETIRL